MCVPLNSFDSVTHVEPILFLPIVQIFLTPTLQMPQLPQTIQAQTLDSPLRCLPLLYLGFLSREESCQ